MTFAPKPSYATPTEWAAWNHDPSLDPGSTAWVPAMLRDLARASRAVDECLIASSYNVDDNGFPNDTDMLDALAEATCIQYAYGVATGDIEGAGDYAGVSAMRVGPETVAFLRTQGIINTNIRSTGA